MVLYTKVMKIIGHRGAAGLELENTLAGLRRAKELGVDGIEIDVRLTSDNKLVLCHDADISRVSDSRLRVASSTLDELKAVKLYNGETIPTLDEALECLGNTWTIIEIKDSNCLQELLEVIARYPQTPLTIASFDHAFAAALEKNRPDMSIFLAERTRGVEVIRIIRHAGADGMDLNAWLLNPLTYWLAKHYKLKIMVYTINHPWVARFIYSLYPDVYICTDYPDRFVTTKIAREKATG